jgi:membrane protease YdiL (CAAX protease family)
LAALLPGAVRAQSRVEVPAVRPAPVGYASSVAPLSGAAVLSVPRLDGVAAPALGVSAAPSAVAPTFVAGPAASASVPILAPAMKAVPAAVVRVETPAAVASAVAPAAHPLDWEFHSWARPPKEETPGWTFRDWPLFSARLWDGSRAADVIGAGVMGTVFAHPTRPHAVVKIARAGFADSAGCCMASDEQMLESEDFDLDRLAALGAAPRILARVEVSGRPGSVRERIYGDTVAALKRDGAYGETEKGLVHDLLARIADGGFVARDLNLGNLMIGRKGGEREVRAWLVDTLGVFEGDGDAAARRAEMLAHPVPWIAWQGLGVARPLSRMLEVPAKEGFGTSRTPISWPKPLRHAALAALLTVLAAVPAAGAMFHAAASPWIPRGWEALAVAGAAIGVAGIPLRLFAHRLAPWVMTRSKDESETLLRRRPAVAVPKLAFGAALEEVAFRGILFMGAAGLLSAVMPPAAAFAAASLGSSLLFALTHGYGSVWTRVVGGMLYAGALAVSGTLLLPIAAHFFFNLALYVHGRYLR